MRTILVGYGDFEDYQLKELPADVLEQLGKRYTLEVPEDSSPEYDDLLITLAIHAELARRRTGGVPEPHAFSRRELARLIIKTGFPKASKVCHPDGKGSDDAKLHHDAQVRLGQVRDELLENCAGIYDGRPDHAIVIPAPEERPPAPTRTAKPKSWHDDVPF